MTDKRAEEIRERTTGARFYFPVSEMKWERIRHDWEQVHQVFDKDVPWLLRTVAEVSHLRALEHTAARVSSMGVGLRDLARALENLREWRRAGSPADDTEPVGDFEHGKPWELVARAETAEAEVERLKDRLNDLDIDE